MDKYQKEIMELVTQAANIDFITAKSELLLVHAYGRVNPETLNIHRLTSMGLLWLTGDQWAREKSAQLISNIYDREHNVWDDPCDQPVKCTKDELQSMYEGLCLYERWNNAKTEYSDRIVAIVNRFMVLWQEAVNVGVYDETLRVLARAIWNTLDNSYCSLDGANDTMFRDRHADLFSDIAAALKVIGDDDDWDEPYAKWETAAYLGITLERITRPCFKIRS